MPLPKFAIVVWVRKTANYQATHDEILELAVQEPYESTEYQGMVDFHWALIKWPTPVGSPAHCANLRKNQRSSSCVSRAETMQSRPRR